MYCVHINVCTCTCPSVETYPINVEDQVQGIVSLESQVLSLRRPHYH